MKMRNIISEASRSGKRRQIPFVIALKGLLLLAALALVTGVDARSPRPPPVRRLHTPRSTLNILPRIPNNPLSRPRSFHPPPPPPSDLRHSDTIHLTLTIPDSDSPAHLLLRPSDHLFHPDAFIRTDGIPTGRLRAEDYRLYHGEVIDERFIGRIKAEETAKMNSGKGVRGTAAIMVLHTGVDGDEPLVEGSFNMDGVTYHVKTSENYLLVRRPDEVLLDNHGPMVIFRESDRYHDVEPEAVSCSHDHHPYNQNMSHPIWQNRHNDLFTPLDDPFAVIRRSDADTGAGGGMSPSSNYINSIGSTTGCPTSQQVVYMGFALDCNYVQTYNGGAAARTQILKVMNEVSALYRSTFQISLGITELVVQNETCPSTAPSDATWNVGCSSGISLDERLSRFSQWRGGRSGDGIGLWHLMSACARDQEVGVAWLGTVCQTGSNRQSGSFVSGTGVSTALQTEWSLVAHEIGHGFGAIHDCTSTCSLSGNCCPFSTTSCSASGRFIMNPTTSSVETAFSPCTIGNICSNIGTRSIQTSCFQTPGGQTTISLQQCGNGIVDPGEQCDPGFNSTSACCDPATCRFRTGAVCDPTNSACCTGSCQFANNGTMCRPSLDDRCDYAEFCTGRNATCPTDQYRSNGESCGGDGLACATGRCTSLNQQCQNSGGANYNFTQSCGQRADTSCVVSCRDPNSSNTCITLQTPLIDGSPCGYGGSCYNSTCQSGPWQQRFQALFTQNLQYSIPITIVVSLIILAILFFLIRAIFRCCSSSPAARKQPRNRNRNHGPLPPPPMRHSGAPSANGTLAPPPPAQGRHSGSVNSSTPMTGAAEPYGYGQQQGGGGNEHSWAYSGNPPPPSGGQGYGQGQGQGQGGHGWVDDSAYNGPNHAHHGAYYR